MVKFRTLYIHELDKWFKFLVEEIFIGDSIEVFKNQWYCDLSRDINGIFVAVDDDENILSSIRVFLREVYLNGEKIRAGGIGSVGTKEEYRGRGLSTSLFNLSIEYMKQKNISISYLLCGNHNEAYYNRYDYRTCRFTKKISIIESHVPYSIEYSIRDVDFSKDIEALSHMYDVFSGTYNGCTVRSIDYWKVWVTSFPYNKYMIAVDMEGKPIAYLNADLDDNRLFVFDFGFLPEHYNIFDSFISKIRSDIKDERIDAQYQQAIYSNMKVEEYVENCMIMYKLINPIITQDMNINNTDELIKALRGDDTVSKLLLWEIDDI